MAYEAAAIHAEQEGIAGKVSVSGIYAVVIGVNIIVSGKHIDIRRLNTLIAVRNSKADSFIVSVLFAKEHTIIGVYAVIAACKQEGTAADYQIGVAVQGIVRRINGHAAAIEGEVAVAGLNALCARICILIIR